MRTTLYSEIPAELRTHCDHVVGEIAQGLPIQHWQKTPDRFARYLTHLTRCSDYDRWTTFVRETEVRQLVVVPAIDFWSACSHHMLPFVGKCWVGYVPDEKFLGLSKIPLLIREIARGFWMQEDLTSTISSRLKELVKPSGVAVHIRATHTCQLLDVGPPIPEMITTELHGLCLHGPAKEEFLGWCR